MTNSLGQGASVTAGILAAIFALEGIFRAFVTPGLPPVPRISDDTFDAPVVVSRQMEEGIASVRFSAAGARLTGNVHIPGAPVIVLLGDSYVVAREVRDSATMGSHVERLARAESIDLNVRQYGWRGASAAQYLDVANEVLKRWDPSQIVVVLSEDDLGADALNRKFPRMTIGTHDQVSLVYSPNNNQPTRAVSTFVLRELIHARWQRVVTRLPHRMQQWGGAEFEPRGPIPDAASLAAVPRATAKALADAFGPNLLIIYTADVRLSFGNEREKGEAELLQTCVKLNIRCASTRDAMIAARERNSIVRGFSTTTLGIGHLNPAGHELMAHEIWKLVRRPGVKSAPQIATR